MIRSNATGGAPTRPVTSARGSITASPAEVVVLGHTHCPDDWCWSELPGKRYFNPGSWTRYAEIDRQARLSLAELKDEDGPAPQIRNRVSGGLIRSRDFH